MFVRFIYLGGISVDPPSATYELMRNGQPKSFLPERGLRKRVVGLSRAGLTSVEKSLRSVSQASKEVRGRRISIEGHEVLPAALIIRSLSKCGHVGLGRLDPIVRTVALDETDCALD
jgi:hypothetical protein